MEPLNRSAFCTNIVAIAYAFEKGKYKEFKKFLHQYSGKYYLRRLGKNLLAKINHVKNSPINLFH